jgi:glycosyltransferase involved in cell wall biosynthesis
MASRAEANFHQRTILWVGHDFKFLRPIKEGIEGTGIYRSLTDEYEGHVIRHPERSRELLRQADLIFCEWCLGNAEWYSCNKRPGQRLVVRLHHQELQLPYLERIRWENVDRLILICPRNMDLLLKRLPWIAPKARLIYNAIDCSSFALSKLEGAEFNVGLLGMSPKRKAPHFALEILAKLKCADHRYTLFIKSKHPWEYKWLWERSEEREYYERFCAAVNSSPYVNSVVFDSHGNDVANWFTKIGFILSTSDHEGSHQAVAEGMASGSLPIIRNWAGAELLYPGRFVFRTLEEAAELIQGLKTVREYPEECRAVRQYAQAHFNQTVIASQYVQLLRDLCPDAGPSGASGRGQVESAYCYGEAPKVLGEKRSLVAMHVCFLTPGRLNGYAIRVMEETRALTKVGIYIVLACFIPEDPPFPAREVDEFQRHLQERTGAKCYLLPTKHFFNIALDPTKESPITTSLITLATTHHVDIVHGQALYSTMHALRARGKMNAKVVFDVHGISPEEMELSGAPLARIRTMSDWERRALKEVDLRVFVSARMRDHFRSKYGLATTLPHCIVPCCVRVDRFEISEEARSLKRKEMGLDGRFVFLYLGTLSVWQWPEALFSVFAQFFQERPDGLLYLLLPHRDHEVALSFCRRHGLSQGSYLISEVPHGDVGLVAGLADAGLLLRKAHPVNAVASPTKLGEYLAAGLPVVTTEDIGDTSDLITSSRVGLVLSPTDEGLNAVELDRLVRFAEDVAATRRECSLRTKSAATLQLAWDRHAATLSNKYHELLNTAQSL